MIQPLEEAPGAINVSGVPYCYFNVTTTNLTGTDIANATIEFKVNRTWINASNIDEATITLCRYYNTHWNAVPTVNLGEDNTSLYFKAVTPGFSVFVISGERKTLTAFGSGPSPSGPLPASEAATEKSSPATIAPMPASVSTPRTMVPRLKEMVISMVISMVSIAVLVIVLVASYARRRERE
jgi:hypothetical protein